MTHFEGEVLAANVARALAGKPLDASFDGHTNCFIETGFGTALLIDFNYDTEPVTGHYPGPVGLPLLKQSRLNHLGKLMFSRPTCSSPSSAWTRSTAPGTSTSSWPPWATRACTWRRGPAGCPACRR